jgi:CHAT domain-containing protein/Tfp pilus assembly protein PilF
MAAQTIAESTGVGPTLPPDAQAKLDKLEADLKAAQDKGDAKTEAATLNQIGNLLFNFGDKQRALDWFNQALPLFRAAGDSADEAYTQVFMGNTHSALGEPQKALDSFNQALPIFRAAGNRVGEAFTLNGLGNSQSALGDRQKALDDYKQALLIFHTLGNSASEAATLNFIGNTHSAMGQPQNALDDYNQALPIFHASGNSVSEALTLNLIGNSHFAMGQPQNALGDYNQALVISRAAGDHAGEARALNNIGIVYDALDEKQKALDYDNQALPIFRATGDRKDEAKTLNNIAAVYKDMGEFEKALDNYNQALPIFDAGGDRGAEAITLNNIGAAYDDLGEKQKALDDYNQALQISRAAGNRAIEATTLNNIGIIYNAHGEKQKALDHYNQAFQIWQAVGNRSGEANTLSNIGGVYGALGEPQKALDYYNQALPIRREVGDRDGEASTLLNIGAVYDLLGEKQKALDYYNQALPIFGAASDPAGQVRTLNNIGLVYWDVNQLQKALDSYNQALPIVRQAGIPGVEATLLENIGAVYSVQGETQKALDYYNQGLPMFRQVGDRAGEAGALTRIGLIHAKLGEKQNAQELYNQALPLATAVGDPLLEAWVLGSMVSNQKNDHPAEAIFFGKQAVNLLQQVRGNIQGLDKQLQTSFVASNANYYHDLADLLIAQNRLPEAEQVLDLLKQQEYSDYTRGAAADTLSPLTLTPAEQQAEQDYQKSTAQIVSLGQQWDELKKIGARTPDQEKQFQLLSAQMDAASKGLGDYYDHLFVVLGGSNSDAKKQVAEIKGDVRALKNAIAESPGTVALYTMVTSDHYRVIVITSSVVPVAREYAISEADLNRKVAAFDQALHDPTSDPRPLAQDLYNILVGPVKADLDQAHAQTLVWSLDGVLRYLPLAALYDGKNYLVEKYSTVTITPASFGMLSQKPDVSKLSVLAMGISRQYENNLPPLPAVVGELDDVVKDPQVQGAQGVLPGTILLNGQFTEKAMEDALNGKYKVVHIASHFVFQPGDDSKSYLLLAGKDDASPDFHLTVEDFNDDQNLDLRSTDLLTLSACQTGMSGDAANGREVDGLGMTAQYKGAKAVISSLWSVNDASTGQLMSDFYKRWASGAGSVSKVEALRQAQLDLLQGKIKVNGSASGRGFDVVATSGPVPAGFAHPYYWAPFVLMGNWQ